MENNYNNGVSSIDHDYVSSGAQKVTGDDLRRIVERSVEIGNKFRPGGLLNRYWEDGKMLVELIRDYFQGSYRHTPWWVISSTAFVLLYILNPLDLMPDFIPMLGQLDDVSVLAICLMSIEQDLKKYKNWKWNGIEVIE